MFRYGANEDIPEGISAELVVGLMKKEFDPLEYYSGIKFAAGKHFEDIGYLSIGTAYGTLLLYTMLNHNCNAYSIDNKQIMSNELIDKYNIKFQMKSIETDEFEYDIKFDAIILTEVFEHFNFKPIATMKKIADMLTDDGMIYFSTPDSNKSGKLGYYSKWDDMPEANTKHNILDAHIYQFNIDELKDIFNQVGLYIYKMNSSNNSNIQLILKKRI